MDRAMAIDTVSGKPSGMETIKITTAVMAILPISRSVSFENKSLSSKRMSPTKKIVWVTTLRMQASSE